MPTEARQWSREELLNLLDSNDKFVEKALLKMYNRQTDDEQNGAYTKHDNGVGFNAFDAELLTSFAQQANMSVRPHGQRLSRKQMQVARKRLRRYIRQIEEEANQ